jgi:hypothetical protein
MMAAAYLDSLHDRLKERSRNLGPALDELCSTLGPRIHAARLAGSQFSAFSLFNPDEPALSRAMALLLSPKGTHGQGSAFLDLFLDKIDRPDLREHSGRAWVRCEVGTLENRRIDLVIELGDFAIGVENKPWADDQSSQLHDYAAYLAGRFSGRFYLVYVSPRGEEPTPESISPADRQVLEQEGRFKVLSYAGEIRPWLQACGELPGVPENVRSFLEDFSDFVSASILGESMTERSRTFLPVSP